MKHCNMCGCIMDERHESDICECCLDDLYDSDPGEDEESLYPGCWFLNGIISPYTMFPIIRNRLSEKGYIDTDNVRKSVGVGGIHLAEVRL